MGSPRHWVAHLCEVSAKGLSSHRVHSTPLETPGSLPEPVLGRLGHCSAAPSPRHPVGSLQCFPLSQVLRGRSASLMTREANLPALQHTPPSLTNDCLRSPFIWWEGRERARVPSLGRSQSPLTINTVLLPRLMTKTSLSLSPFYKLTASPCSRLLLGGWGGSDGRHILPPPRRPWRELPSLNLFLKK